MKGIGNKVERTIEKVVINEESIDVISNSQGVSSVAQLNLEPQENEVSEIFERNRLNNINNFPFDMKIVRALSENEDQLKDYLETCRRVRFAKGKQEIPQSIPEIEYDLRKLKESDIEIHKQLEMLRQANESKNMLKGKVRVQMSLMDRAYFAVQKLLKNRETKTAPMLESGKNRNSLRESLRVDPQEMQPIVKDQNKEERQEEKVVKEMSR